MKSTIKTDERHRSITWEKPKHKREVHVKEIELEIKDYKFEDKQKKMISKHCKLLVDLAYLD